MEASTENDSKTSSGLFAGRTALVTGAAGDIGRATARRLAAGGATVILADLERSSGLAKTVDECAEASNGKAAATVTFDVTDEERVVEVFESLRQDGLVPDLLFNNAGYQGDFANTADYQVPDFRRVLDINLTGVFVVLREFARGLIEAERPGAVVNAASMAHTGGPNMVAYSASKGGVVSLTKSAAKDLAPKNIRVNCISPAFIGPGMMWDRQVELQANTPSQYYSDDVATVAEEMISQVPLRRYGSLDEVAALVQFLLSEESSYITAFNAEVSGGA